MKEVLDKQGLKIESTALIPAGGKNGSHAMVQTGKLPISQNVTNEAMIEEERQLAAIESEVGGRYVGLRGYLRLFSVTRVIAMLSLYLYLDQYYMHRAQQLKHAKGRLEKAERLTRAAVYGEKLYAVRTWFLHIFMLRLRRFFLGSESNKEANQEKQAVWLKEKLIELGPTFIKIGQSMGTRPDLLPLPFVIALGELQDNVPAFPNEIAFARIEKELGRKISEVYQEFDVEPVAAASLGQVYRAKLFTGEEVAVKIQRPNLAGIIKGDIEIFRTLSVFERKRGLGGNVARV